MKSVKLMQLKSSRALFESEYHSALSAGDHNAASLYGVSIDELDAEIIDLEMAIENEAMWNDMLKAVA